MGGQVRILVSDKLAGEGVEVLRQAGFAVDVKTGMAPEALYAVIGGYDGLVVRSATKARGAFWEHAGGLRLIGRAGTGVDNIDLAAATAHGTLVENTPGGNNVSAAEHAIGLMFALSRHIPRATASMKAGKWQKSLFKGAELTGKTLGLVGVGAIGGIVADRAQGLAMKVLAFDPFIDEGPAGVTMVDFDTLLGAADYVSIHAPLNAKTRGLIDGEALAKMKPGARLIHAARGGIVVEADLLASLQSGHLAGAAIDVWETEPTAADNPLLALDNVVATPHLGASTHEAQIRVAVQIAEQFVAFFKDGTVLNPVNTPG